jgi:hypothetical protein
MAILNKKGQANIIMGLLAVFVSVIVFSALIPLLSEIITNTSENLSGMAAVVLGLIPLAIAVAILSSVFVLVRPQPRQY